MWRVSVMIAVAVSVAFLLLGAAEAQTAPPSTAQQQDVRPLVVQFWQIAVSNGDVVGVAGFFVPDATRYDNGAVLAVGRDAIQATFARQAAQHPVFKIL